MKNVNKIEYFEYLSDAQKRDQIMQVLNFSGNNTGRDKYGVVALFSNCSNILEEYTDEKFKKSLKNSLECIKNNNYKEKLSELKSNDPKSFIMFPMTSKNYLFNTIIYKNDDGYECIIVNKGERVFGEKFEREIHHSYEAYAIKEENMDDIIPYLGVKRREETIAEIYNVFSDKSYSHKMLTNIVSRDQIEDNGYFKELEAGLKFAYSNGYGEFEKKGQIEIPKWPIGTKEMQNRIVENIAKQDNSEEMLLFARHVLEIYNKNKEFRDNFRANATLMFAKEKEMFDRNFNPNGDLKLEQCLNLVDVKTFRKHYKFFNKLLKDANIEVPEGIFIDKLVIVKDTRDQISQVIQADNSGISEAFLEKNFSFVLKETMLKISEDFVKMGNQFADEGKNLEAIKLFDRAITFNPDNIRAYEERGKSYILIQEFEKANRDLEKVCEIDKNDINFRVLFAESLIAVGQEEEALKQYNELLKMEPTSGDIMLKIANITYQLERLEESLERFNELLKVDPDNKLALYKKLDILKELDLTKEISYPEEILKVCNEILRLDKDNINIIKEKVQVLAELKRREEAVECIIGLDIEEKEFNALKEKLLKEQLTEYNKILSKDSNNLEVKKKRADIIKELGGKIEAIDVYSEILDIDPKNIDVMLKKAKVLEELKNDIEAYDLYKEILEISPKNVDVLVRQAKLLKEYGKYSHALEKYNEILKLDPKNIEIMEEKAKVFELQENKSAAISQYKEIQKITPLDKELVLKIIELAEQNRYNEELLNQCTKMLELDKNNIEIMRKRASVLGKLGRKEEAINQCNKILENHPTDLITKDLKKNILNNFRLNEMRDKGFIQ